MKMTPEAFHTWSQCLRLNAETEALITSIRSSPPPQVSPKPTQPRVGQPTPVRDPFGETSTVSVRKTAGCSFAEVIDVTLSQMEEAGVSHFECPMCLAVRDIEPKRTRVKFPSHPKRMTAIPNQGSRWLKEKDIWKLFTRRASL